jgi:hypothetical protein
MAKKQTQTKQFTMQKEPLKIGGIKGYLYFICQVTDTSLVQITQKWLTDEHAEIEFRNITGKTFIESQV